MARDAIARQYDVDKNAVVLICETDQGQYRPGTIHFSARKGRSVDLEKLRESIAATRLSGGTNMRVDRLDITARGEVVTGGPELLFKVSGTGQEFVLAEDPGAKEAFQRLRETRGAKITTVTGRVQGWDGRFPDVLRALAAAGSKPTRLYVTDFENGKK
jgi:hypothetical protein